MKYRPLGYNSSSENNNTYTNRQHIRPQLSLRGGRAPYELPNSRSPLPLHSLVSQRLHGTSAVNFIVCHLLWYVAMVMALVGIVLAVPIALVRERLEQVFLDAPPVAATITLYPALSLRSWEGERCIGLLRRLGVLGWWHIPDVRQATSLRGMRVVHR